ncbi:MAG: VWA domain-containing protein [Alkalinema sp. RU_4_3]|nr:VWA domain-containing protein [Alkalinema sp. RU_4_3]
MEPFGGEFAGVAIEAPRVVVQNAFRQVRKAFGLGVGELQAAIEAVDGGFGQTDSQALGVVLRSLWCHSVLEQSQWDEKWEKLMRELAARQREERAAQRMEEDREETHGEEERSLSPQTIPSNPVSTPSEDQSPAKAGFSPLPVQVPSLEEEMDEFDLRTVGPVSRRSMSYGWRSLRRWRSDGPRSVVDVGATVGRLARLGAYTGPVLVRQRASHGRLVLLVDQQGSMVPFHRWSRDLVETARAERTIEVNVFYFYNVPQAFLYLDEHLTRPIAMAEVLAGMEGETVVMLVSDAGRQGGGGIAIGCGRRRALWGRCDRVRRWWGG